MKWLAFPADPQIDPRSSPIWTTKRSKFYVHFERHPLIRRISDAGSAKRPPVRAHRVETERRWPGILEFEIGAKRLIQLRVLLRDSSPFKKTVHLRIPALLQVLHDKLDVFVRRSAIDPAAGRAAWKIAGGNIDLLRPLMVAAGVDIIHEIGVKSLPPLDPEFAACTELSCQVRREMREPLTSCACTRLGGNGELQRTRSAR